jgi:hypothetical protein
MQTPNFELFFQSCGECFIVIASDAPTFTIVAATDAYLVTSHTTREAIIGRPLFEVFPDNPEDTSANGVANLTASLERVLETKKADYMPIQKYDIADPEKKQGFEERYWIPRNTPILDADGNVLYIIQHVSDATQQEDLIHRFGGDGIEADKAHALSQIERLNKIMVSRELRMIELKKELAKFKGGADR